VELSVDLAQEETDPSPHGMHMQRQRLVNFGDAQYVMYFKMGRQRLGGLIDTVSSELVLFRQECAICSAAETHYTPEWSRTFRKGNLKALMTFGRSQTPLAAAFEDVAIGHFRKIDQAIWQVDEASVPALLRETAAFQAVMGMGPPEQTLAEVWSRAEKLVLNVSSYYEQGMDAPQPAVDLAEELVETALEFARRTPVLQAGRFSSFSVCLGGLPRSNGVLVWNDTLAYEHPRIFTRVPVISKHQWTARLTFPELRRPVLEELQHPVPGGGMLHLGCLTGCRAIFDTSSSLIGVPPHVRKRVADWLSYMDPYCTNPESMPDLVFQLGGSFFSLPSSSYLALVEGEVPLQLVDSLLSLKRRSECKLMLADVPVTDPFEETWILGVPFFRRYYTTFMLGESKKERTLYMAPHERESCRPARRLRRNPQFNFIPGRRLLPVVNASRLHLPSLPENNWTFSLSRHHP